MCTKKCKGAKLPTSFDTESLFTVIYAQKGLKYSSIFKDS